MFPFPKEAIPNILQTWIPGRTNPYRNVLLISLLPRGGGSAVGVPKDEEYWFIAVVKNNTELSVQKKLASMEIASYVPTQEKLVITPAGRKTYVSKPAIPALIFIFCTENLRKEIVNLPFINRFVVDLSRTKDEFNRHPIAHIPNDQIEKLKFMVGNSNGSLKIQSGAIRLGSHVKVVRGALKGLIGQVERLNNETWINIRIDALGYAGVKVKASDIKEISSHPSNE